MSSVEEAQEFFSRKYTFMGDELAKHIMTILNELDNKNKDIERLIKENEEWQRVYQEEKEKQFEILRNSISKDKMREILEKLEIEYKEELDKNSIKAFILKCKMIA